MDDALSAVIESEGPERAHFLLSNCWSTLRQKSIETCLFSATTGYVNELTRRSVSGNPLDIEERLRVTCAGNAMAMVVRANRQYPVDGGRT
jgi:pyruvate dehydrogenase E1 component